MLIVTHKHLNTVGIVGEKAHSTKTTYKPYLYLCVGNANSALPIRLPTVYELNVFDYACNNDYRIIFEVFEDMPIAIA